MTTINSEQNTKKQYLEGSGEEIRQADSEKKLSLEKCK